MIVVDASIALKLFFEERQSTEAEELISEWRGKMCMPEQFVVEVLGGLVREANLRPDRTSKSRQGIRDFLQLADEGAFYVKPAFNAFARAANVALDLRHPIKDCIYLACALEWDCLYITADRKFAERAQPQFPIVRLLGEPLG